MIPNDPVMLLSFINMKLRDNYNSLVDLCEDLQLDEASLKERLEAINYFYDEVSNQFR
jgi:hypothetical protein